MTSLHLRELARRALHERRPDPGGDVEIERVVIDVRLGERVELVTLSVRGDRLVVLATDGTASTSPAAHAALSWLAADLPRTSLVPEARERSTRSGEMTAVAPLDVAIGDLATAIVRTGTNAGEAPAILDALARIGAASSSLEVARWVGRLRGALAARDEIGVARLLDGASTLEAKDEPERVVDHLWVELGRELLDGLTPFAIERRHLLDPSSGEVLAEERLRDQAASNGPCPRVVNAGLATRSPHGRVRIVQYAVAELDAEVRARIDALASPSLADAFARAEKRGLRSASIEPVSLVRLGPPTGGKIVDGAGEAIPLARAEDAAAVTALADALASGTPEWLFGRWCLAGDTASVVPLSCSVSGRIVRLR